MDSKTCLLWQILLFLLTFNEVRETTYIFYIEGLYAVKSFKFLGFNVWYFNKLTNFDLVQSMNQPIQIH